VCVTSTAFLSQPVDPAIASRLASQGLRMALLDTTDRAAVEAWSEAATRGFHGGRLSPERHAEYVEANRRRRNTGVWDDASPSAEPVGTSNSWVSRLALPGQRTIDAWAISTVTVASTHHKRGIARALLEAELAAAVTAGLPMAMLTVSESTLYQRYGFAPAAWAADYEFNTRRVTWAGPTPGGRVEYIDNAQFGSDLGDLHARLLVGSPGQVELWPLRVAQLAGTSAADEERGKKLRAIRYVDEAGATRGIANYTLSGGDDDFTAHTLSVQHIVTETPDAYAAIWRYLLEVPLVEKVRVEHQRIDEPVMWMITDMRAARVTVWEHQYLRILDVPRVFEGRGYVADGEVGFEVTDPYGYAAGRWLLRVQDGVGRVEPAPGDSAVPALSLGVAELSAVCLGGVRASTLLDAGRVRESVPGAAAIADRVLASPVVPFLSIWY
jgi:predicted acetyltransferase